MGKYRILICDDEEIIRESMRVYLENEYEIAMAKDGREAIDSVRCKDFDLIIMDIKMPEVDGIEAIEEIKKIKPEQKIIVFTGYESINTAEEASKLGVNSYLIKPLGREKVLKAVREALE